MTELLDSLEKCNDANDAAGMCEGVSVAPHAELVGAQGLSRQWKGSRDIRSRRQFSSKRVSG